MRKKTSYWVLAILAVLVVVGLLYVNFSNNQDTRGLADGTGHEIMNHAEMGHGQPDSSEDSLSLYWKEQDAIMSTMMKDMNGIPYSGNAAIDFLSGMIPHHAAAISMAESYLNHGGTHSVLAPLAQDIITAQTNEINQMESMIESIQSKGIQDTEQADAYLAAYHRGMHHDTTHATDSKNIDAAFAEGMILHHQMAVDMATAIRPYTTEEDVLALARTIIDTQNQEIASMQSVLAESQGS